MYGHRFDIWNVIKKFAQKNYNVVKDVYTLDDRLFEKRKKQDKDKLSKDTKAKYRCLAACTSFPKRN